MTVTRPGEALAQAYDGITAVVGGLDDTGLQRATRCQGWLIADLLLHVLGDAQRALVALASPVDGPADADHVSYWRDFAGDDDKAAARHAWWVRRSAAAFDRPTGIVQLWRDTAPAAVRAAASADPEGHVTTQGHVLRVPDLLATLTTEAVIHHLDLTPELPGAPAPGPWRYASRWPPWTACSATTRSAHGVGRPRLPAEGNRAPSSDGPGPTGVGRVGGLVPLLG
ncbi:maleylpyruvate isomerase N-terminal domain-containing protein [Micromonospora sp. M12]